MAKLANIAWQTLLFVSESLDMDKKVTPDLRRKQQRLASNVSQFRQAFDSQIAKKLSLLKSWRLRTCNLSFSYYNFEDTVTNSEKDI